MKNNDSYNDADYRLECLQLAMASGQLSTESTMKLAQAYYNFICPQKPVTLADIIK